MKTGPMRRSGNAIEELRAREKAMTADTRVRIFVRVEPELRKKIREIALKEDITMNEFLFQAINMRLTLSGVKSD